MRIQTLRARASLTVMLLALLSVAGCATKTVEINPIDFPTQPLAVATFEPSPEQLVLRKPRVAILPLELQDQNGNQPDINKNLEPALRGELETALLSGGKVNLLDRNLAQRLQGALADYERLKGETPKPFKQADYLVIGQINLATINSEYKAETVTRKGRVLPGICITEANITGVLKIYDLFENEIQDIQEINGRKRNVDEAPKCPSLNQSLRAQYYQQATSDAAEKSQNFLSAFFAPIGYISEKRSNGKVWAFKVHTLGSAMAEYREVKIMETNEVVNQLTNQVDLETLPLGNALVTKTSGSDFIWIQVNDRTLAERIKLGHVVRPIPKSANLFDYIPKLKF